MWRNLLELQRDIFYKIYGHKKIEVHVDILNVKPIGQQRETVPSLTSDMGKKIVSVIVLFLPATKG